MPLSASAITKFMHITITVPVNDLGKGKRLNRLNPLSPCVPECIPSAAADDEETGCRSEGRGKWGEDEY